MSEKFKEGDSTPVIQEFSREELGSPSFDKSADRRPPMSPEMAEKTDRKLRALSDLMSDSSFWWQLAGSLAISAQKGEYIGYHADLDMVVMKEELPQLEKHLAAQGYGLFLRAKDEKKLIFRRVGKDAFKRSEDYRWQPDLVKIDDSGTIDTKTDLVWIDMAGPIYRNEKRQATGWRGVVYPERWLKSREVEFHGAKLQVESPAIYLFNKIWHNRGGYEEKDIDELLALGTLTMQDVAEVEEAVYYIFGQFNRSVASGEMSKEMADTSKEMVLARIEKIKQALKKE